MYKAIVILLENDTQTQEEINNTARKFLDCVQEMLCDNPEIILSRPSDFGLISNTTLSDFEWLYTQKENV